MFRPRLLIRFVALMAMTMWVGGFTFYAGVVIPILHEFMPESEAGEITRRVTVALNIIGLVTILCWALLLIVERHLPPAKIRQLRGMALVGSAVLLAGQAIVHRVLDARLDAGTLRGFYPLHRVYVGGSTLQWGLNLVVLFLSVVLWNASWEDPPKENPTS